MLYQTVTFQILKPLDQTWQEAGKLLRELQYLNAKAMNYAITELYKWETEKITFHDVNNRWPDKDEMPRPNVWQMVRNLYPDLSTSIVDQLSQAVDKKWKSERKEVLFTKTRSLSSFRKTYPLSIRARGCTLAETDEGEVTVTFSLRPRIFEKTRFKFLLATKINDNAKLTILRRLLNGEYKQGSVQIFFNERKKKWMLNISYGFESVENGLDSDTRVGVDLGIKVPVYCAVNNLYKRFSMYDLAQIIMSYRNQIYKRRNGLLRTGKDFYENRQGHGRKRKLQPIVKFKSRYNNFKKTTNHKIARAVVNFALSVKAGVIVLENLSGIHDRTDDLFLKNWPYYQLQQFIIYKAEAANIKVEIVHPRYTSQRCSRCGNIDSENRINQADFKCTLCGQTFFADYNAAKNISIESIEQKISETLNAKACA
jgi:putative transposase